VAFSLLIFYAFAMQCMSTLAVVRKETGSWKMTLVMLIYMTALAYGASFLVYQLFS
jgi:ferrous iron transport protein B